MKEFDDLIQRALGLLHSPRVRENDAAARLFKLIFYKYVVGKGLLIR